MTAVSNGSSLAAMDLYQCFRPSGARQLAAAISARFGQGLSLKRFLHCVWNQCRWCARPIARISLLATALKGARNGTERAEHATIAGIGLHNFVTASALVEIQARV